MAVALTIDARVADEGLRESEQLQDQDHRGGRGRGSFNGSAALALVPLRTEKPSN
jgi:hypothetical protein